MTHADAKRLGWCDSHALSCLLAEHSLTRAEGLGQLSTSTRKQDTSAGSNCNSQGGKAPRNVQCLALWNLHLRSHPASLGSLSGASQRHHPTDQLCSLSTRCWEGPTRSFSSFLPKGCLYSL